MRIPSSNLVFSAAATLLLAGAAIAQQAPSEAPRAVPEELVEAKGRRAGREAYIELRRQVPPDATFTAGQARRAALEARQSAARQLAGREAILGLTPTTWQPFGPAPIALGQTPTGTPRYPSDVSGRTVGLAIDATDGEIYIGGAQGGVWKSTDDGATWQPLTDQLLSLAIDAIALDPADNDVMYIGTGEGNSSCDSYAGVGIYKSIDGGANWTGPTGGAQFANRSVPTVEVDRTSSLVVYAGSSSGIFGNSCTAAPTLPDRGVYKSTDGGATWTKKTPSNLRVSRILQDPQTATTWWAAMVTSGGSLFPADEGGLRKSIDNGETWNQVAGTGGLPALATSWGRAWITGTTDPDFPGQSVLYLSSAQDAGGGQGQGRVFKSVDSGTTWTEKTAARGYCNAQCFYDMPVYVEPGNEQVFYTGGAGDSSLPLPTQFMRSDDGGTSFADKVRSADATNALHADVHEILTWPGQPTRLWTTNDGGVWRSIDKGDNWVNVNSNLQLTQFTACDLHPTNPNWAYGGSQDNGTEGALGSLVWKHLDFGDGGFALIDQANPSNLVHTYYNQSNNLIGVGYTTNGFNTTMGNYLGSFASSNGIAIADRVLFYAPIHLDRGVSSTLYFGTHKLYRASNFFAGSNFAVLAGGQDLTGGAGTNGRLSAIETLASGTPGVNASVILTGSSDGRIFRSTTGGTSFTQEDAPGRYVSDVAISPANPSIVLASLAGFAGSVGQNVRRSTDGGDTWGASGSGLPDIPVNALAWDPSDANTVYAGTDVGVYASTDGGLNWVPYSTGMPNVAVFDLKSNPATNRVLACTHGRGSWILIPGSSLFSDGFEPGDATRWNFDQP